VVTAAHKFDFGLVLNEITNGDRWKGGHAVTDTRVLHTIYVFSPRPSSRVLRDTTDAVQVFCILFTKPHYMERLSFINQQSEYNLML